MSFWLGVATGVGFMLVVDFGVVVYLTYRAFDDNGWEDG